MSWGTHLSYSGESITNKSKASVDSIAIIHNKVNYLTIGSIITITKNYVDKVYLVMDNYDDRIYKIALSLDVEVFNASKNEYTTLVSKIRNESNAKVIVMLHGDGSHDPARIPEFFSYIEHGYDVVIGSSNYNHNSRANETIMFLNNKMLNNSQKDLIACSYRYFERLNFDAIPTNRQTDIGEVVILQSKNSDYKAKSLYVEDKNFGIFSMYKIGVVMPAYNEEMLIGDTIRGIPNYIDKIFVIDDCSTDRMPEVVKSLGDSRVVYIRHEINKGVGAAIVTGYKAALEYGMDIIVTMDGDNQMDPEQLPRLLIPIIEDKADYTKGNRLISKEFRKGMSKWRSFGNFILTMLTKIASGYWSITDPQNGYTAMSRQALEVLDLDAVYTYYGYLNDLLVKLNAYGMRALNVPIPSRYGKERSKIKYGKYIRKVSLMLFRDFLWRLKTKYILLDFNPLVLFYAASMIMLPFGAIFSAWILVEKIMRQPISPNFPLLAVFITLMGLQFLMFAMLFDMQAEKRSV